MNLKEAMHGDEKLEYAPEAEDLTDNINAMKENINPEVDIEFEAKVISESDPMNMSFYQDKENNMNPFDMNAVHPLPVDEDDDDVANKSEDHSQKIVLEGEQGERFVIEDNEFGMNDNLISQSQDEISKPEEDMYSPISENDNKIVDDMHHYESDKPESELLFQDEEHHHEISPIVQAIEAVTSQVNSLLSNINDAAAESPLHEQFEVESFVENIKGNENDKYNESGLSPTAAEFTPHFNINTDVIEEDILVDQQNALLQGLTPTNLIDEVERNGSPVQTNAIIETMAKQTHAVVESVLETNHDLFHPQIYDNHIKPEDIVYQEPTVEEIKAFENISFSQAEPESSRPEPEIIAAAFEQESERNDSGLEAEYVLDESLSQPDVEITDTISESEKTESEAHENEIIESVTQQINKISLESTNIIENNVNDESSTVEAPPPTPAVIDAEIHPRISTPEPQQIVEAVEKLVVEPHTADESASNEIVSEVAVVAAAAVAATTLAATAAVAASSADKSLKTKVTDTTKSKAASTKTSTRVSTTTAPKKTNSPSTTTLKPSTAKPSTTAKPAPKPTSTLASKPKSAPASHPAKTSTSTIEKKTSNVSNVIKKPLTNGDVKLLSTASTARKTTTNTKVTEGVTKTSSGTVKSTTTTTRTSVSAPKTTATTLTKTTVHKTTVAPKVATTTKATPATKPPTTLPTKPRTVPAVSSSVTATKTTTRPSLSPTKPKTTITSTNTDKLSKDTTNKARTASNTLTPTKTIVSSPRTTTTTVRKVADIKSPVGGATKSKTTTTTTTTTRTSSVGVGAKKPATTTRTSITKKTSSTTPISKPGHNDNKATTKVTTIKLEKQILNGDVISETAITKTAQFDCNGELIIENNGLLIKDDSPIQPPLDNNSQMIVIDSAAD
jgi:hypothetical protein